MPVYVRGKICVHRQVSEADGRDLTSPLSQEVPRDQTLPRRCAHAATSPEACAPAVRCHVDGNSAFECDPTRIEAPLSLNAAVPNIVHWVSSGADGEFFPYWALLTASAVMDVLTPETFYFHHTAGCLPSGPHWALVVQWLTLSPRPAIEEVYGNPTRLKAHRSDVMRLQALLKHGGIYVDWDVLPLRSFASLMRNSFVIGLQSERRCANAVIVAEPHAEFVVRWLDAYHSFNERDWDGHSVRLPWQLAERFPGTAVLLPRTAWFTPGPDDDPGYQLFQRNTSAQTSPEQRPFALHLWHQISGVFLEQITGPEWLKENKHTRFARELGHMAQRGGRVAAAVG